MPQDTYQLDAVQAVVFDLGGVFLEGGPGEVAAFGMRHGMTQADWEPIRQDLFLRSDHWGQLERGETTLAHFAELVQARMAAKGCHISHAEAGQFMRPPGEANKGGHLRDRVVAVAEMLHQRMPTALLTNNVREWREGWRQLLDLPRLFDLVVDSSEIGMRKPEPRIYAHTERLLGLPPTQLLFVDDLGANLKAAHQRGWHTIKYDDTARVLAILERLRARPLREVPCQT